MVNDAYVQHTKDMKFSCQGEKILFGKRKVITANKKYHMTIKKCDEIMKNTNEVGTQTEERVVEKNAATQCYECEFMHKEDIDTLQEIMVQTQKEGDNE